MTMSCVREESGGPKRLFTRVSVGPWVDRSAAANLVVRATRDHFEYPPQPTRRLLLQGADRTGISVSFPYTEPGGCIARDADTRFWGPGKRGARNALWRARYFYCHSVPKSYLDKSDPYHRECFKTSQRCLVRDPIGIKSSASPAGSRPHTLGQTGPAASPLPGE